MTRSAQLAIKRRELQLRCALQRYEIAELSHDFEARLTGVGRVIDIAISVAKHPIAILAAFAGAIFIGPWRIIRWVSRGAMLFNVARQVQRLIAK